jgi:hypothetical protein
MFVSGMPIWFNPAIAAFRAIDCQGRPRSL